MTEIGIAVGVCNFAYKVRYTVSRYMHFSYVNPREVVYTTSSELYYTKEVRNGVIGYDQYVTPMVHAPVRGAVFRHSVLSAGMTLYVFNFSNSIQVCATSGHRVLRDSTVTTIGAMVTMTVDPVKHLQDLGFPHYFIEPLARGNRTLNHCFLFYVTRQMCTFTRNSNDPIPNYTCDDFREKVTHFTSPYRVYYILHGDRRKGRLGRRYRYRRNHRGPILAFLFRLSSFLSSLFTFLRQVPHGRPSEFLPRYRLPYEFRFPRYESRPNY